MGPRFRLATAILYGFMTLWSLFVMIPVLLMLLAAFKTKRDIFLDPLGLPSSLEFDSFARAWNTGMDVFMLNSAIVTVVSVAVIVLCSGMAAYALARSERRIMKIIYLLIVAGFAVPVQAVLVPLFQMVSAAGFLNSQLAIILPYAAYGIPFTTILFYAFFLDFPERSWRRRHASTVAASSPSSSASSFRCPGRPSPAPPFFRRCSSGTSSFLPC